MAKTKTEPTSRQPGWLNQSELASSLGISVQALKRWGLQPIAKIGRESFYTAAQAVDNRVEHALNKQGKHLNQSPAQDLSSVSDPVERLKAERMQEEITKLRLQNSVLEGRSLPAWVVTEVVTRVLSVAVSVFETMPLDIKRRHPDLDVRIIRMIEERIAKIRNEAASVPEQFEDILDDVVSEAEERIR
nr:hypothetical protein 22 [Saccharospirillaceae bacterium]